MKPLHILACHQCDALLSAARDRSAVFYCPRCNATVLRAVPKRLDHALALFLAAGVCFVLANVFPIVAIEAAGATVYTTLIGAVQSLHAESMNIVAVVVVLTTLVIPSIELLCVILLLMLAQLNHSSWALSFLFRVREALRPWSMVEIFVLGSLVAIVKLGNIANVVLGIGIWSMGAFIILSAAASHVFDPLEFWSEIKVPTTRLLK